MQNTFSGQVVKRFWLMGIFSQKENLSHQQDGYLISLLRKMENTFSELAVKKIR